MSIPKYTSVLRKRKKEAKKNINKNYNPQIQQHTFKVLVLPRLSCLLRTAVFLSLFTARDRCDIPFNVKLL